MEALVRRAIVAAGNGMDQPSFSANDTQPGEPPSQLNPAHFSVLAGSFLIYVLILLPLAYTLGCVVATLVIVETPAAATPPKDQLPPYRDNEEDVPSGTSPVAPIAPAADDLAVDDHLVSQEAITSSIRSTIRHVTRIGGFWARWRGFASGATYNIGSNFIMFPLMALLSLLPLPDALLSLVASAIAVALLSPLHMAWTHAIISTPSSVRWYRRVRFGRKYWRPLIVPAVAYAVAYEAVSLVTMLVFKSFFKAMDGPDGYASKALISTIIGGICLTLATVMLGFALVVLPTMAILTRVEASLLPDDMEMIVKFDRTLSGAAPLAGDSFKELSALYRAAWRRFDKYSWRRLVKFYAKYYAITIGLTLIVVAVFAAVLAIGLRK